VSRPRKPIRSDSGWSTPDRIVVYGKDLPGELLGKVSLGDMAFLGLTRRIPTREDSRLFNAMVVTLVEHGITPSALAARLTYLGAPEAMQAAVAAGLCGLGSVFVGSTEHVAKMLSENPDPKTLKRVPGLGHPIHKPIDPRTVRLFEIARETGFYGKHCKRMEEIAKQRGLVLNATGAIGALACELGLDWRAVRGLGVMARAGDAVYLPLRRGRNQLVVAVIQCTGGWAYSARLDPS